MRFQTDVTTNTPNHKICGRTWVTGSGSRLWPYGGARNHASTRSLITETRSQNQRL